ncbi:hypothetical protein SAMN04487916_12235 [Arthrobacter sp. ov407]|uniref:hypothetical protein n=1 Tax=Arthrobacter sp. ov407 TaxID=1761748 RepID=UPI00088D5AF3|nr:hypothetical protein [Arthrobacter sp. ov407]SDM03117.1 hypothetical protein SAMN04487916_12235 [Arthrobacter sp. ov407]
MNIPERSLQFRCFPGVFVTFSSPGDLQQDRTIEAIKGFVKPLPAEAYDALADALAKIYWHRKTFQRYVQLCLRDAPELLVGLPFDETKRSVAHELVDRLALKELRYRDLTLSLMLEIGAIQDSQMSVQPRIARTFSQQPRMQSPGSQGSSRPWLWTVQRPRGCKPTLKRGEPLPVLTSGQLRI